MTPNNQPPAPTLQWLYRSFKHARLLPFFVPSISSKTVSSKAPYESQQEEVFPDMKNRRKHEGKNKVIL